MNQKRRALALVVVASRVVLDALAYDESTNEILSEAAARRSVLATDSGLLAGLGLPPLDSGSFPSFTAAPPGHGDQSIQSRLGSRAMV
jgi:hypothetical protein